VLWGIFFAAWLIASGVFLAYGMAAILVLAPLIALLTFLERRLGLRPVAARTFSLVLTSIATLGFGAAALDQYRSNVCRPGLSYPCDDTYWEILWALACVFCALLVVVQIHSWIRPDLREFV
jgi:hypothetical protein